MTLIASPGRTLHLASDGEILLRTNVLRALLEVRYGTPLVHQPGHVRRLSEEMGIHRSTVQHILNEDTNPGLRFVTRLLQIFPEYEFTDLFKVVTPAE